jgi:hypothetical protein
MLYDMDKQRENGALLIAACIVAASRTTNDSISSDLTVAYGRTFCEWAFLAIGDAIDITP